MKIRWRTIRKVWAVTGSVVFVIFLLWNLIAYQPWGVSAATLRSDDRVDVSHADGIYRFTPKVRGGSAGLVFFPGALVDPEAYAPMARRVAESGFPVVMIELPWRLARTGEQEAVTIGRAESLIKAEPEIRWLVGGHSRGGALATVFAARNPEAAHGLLLIGTSHPRELDLSASPLKVTKIYGTRDGLASVEEVRQFAPNLPPSTRFVPIEGGNHGQFGWYGFQPGDRFAKISREEQQRLLLEAVLAALRQV